MATQLKPTDFQPIPYPAARTKLRVVFDTTATRAVAATLAQMPPAMREATLEEIEVASAAEALIATARQVLSPHVYDLFLAWGEAAATEYEACDDNDVCMERSTRRHLAIDDAYATIPVTFEDMAFKTWLAGVEAGDCPVFGPLRPLDSFGTGITNAVTSVANDLARTSVIARELDRFAALVSHVNGSSFSWSVPLSEAIVAVFATGRQVLADADPAEAFAPASEPATPFYRGLLLDWRQACERHEATRKALAGIETTQDNSDAAIDAVADAHSDALTRVLLTPAPSAAALATKLRLYVDTSAWELNVDAIGQALAADARRFARLGAATTADAGLMAAFDAYRSALRDLKAQPADATQAEDDVLFRRMDAPELAMANTSATTIEGVVAKLRYGFQASNQDRWVSDAITAPDSTDFAEGLVTANLYERALWGAVEDLARIAGVDLTGRVS